MNNTSREDLNFLLGASIEDFDMFSALEAYHTLMDVFLDLNFQLEASELDFKGRDKESWELKAKYKQNRVVEAARRFSRRYRELKEDSAGAKLEEIFSLVGQCHKTSQTVDFFEAVRRILNGG